jgi:hypothetical protein
MSEHKQPRVLNTADDILGSFMLQKTRCENTLNVHSMCNDVIIVFCSPLIHLLRHLREPKNCILLRLTIACSYFVKVARICFMRIVD